MSKYSNLNIKGLGKVPTASVALIISVIIRLFSKHFFPQSFPFIENLTTFITIMLIAAFVIMRLLIYINAVRRNRAELEN